MQPEANSRPKLPTGTPGPHLSANYYGLIGHSAAMLRIYERIERFARSPIPVLILGETGTGKERVAAAFRQVSGGPGPFVTVNCGALPEGVLASELFGHERGAFTGASRRHRGLLAQADGGILFLDEIGELPLAAQVKLFRAMDTGEYRPVGSERTFYSRFRLIAATNRDLDSLVEQKLFREELLQRLGMARIALPPLRERLEDLPALAEEFLRCYRVATGSGPTRLTPGALRVLRSHTWPGNVRALRNVIEAAAGTATGSTIEAAHLIEFFPHAQSTNAGSSRIPTLAEAVRRAEWETIQAALRSTGGHRERAARLLGIGVATLRRHLGKGPPAQR
jgi:DNA-binding NtrC family response regulator